MYILKKKKKLTDNQKVNLIQYNLKLLRKKKYFFNFKLNLYFSELV